MNPGDTAYLHHIMNAINQIEHYTRGMSESEFLSRPMVQDAVARQMEIVIEASRNISAEFQGQHPRLPWSKTIGTREKIILKDFSLNISTIWDTIQDDLPFLKQMIKKLI